jgi:lipoprotein-releasing system permease protein
MNVELFVALRYIKARRNGVFTLLTTLIATGGTALGVAALIITLAVMSGFHRDIRSKILGLQPHLTIIRQDQRPLVDYAETAKAIASDKEVIASSPFVYGQTILRNGRSMQGVVVKGIDFEQEKKVVNIQKAIVTPPSKDFALTDEGILIGKELARNLGATVGDDVVLMSPSLSGQIPKMRKLKVSGIFDSGMYEYDSNLAYVSLQSGQQLFDLGGSVTGIGVAVRDWENSSKIERQVQNLVEFPLIVRSWERMNKSLFAALKLEKIMMFIILTLIIVVAAFNIVSNLLLLTVEKAKEIGILSALGFKKSSISRIFFYQGMIIGLSGIVSGLFLGIGISELLNKYKFIHLPADVYYIDTLPVKIFFNDVSMVVLATLLITLFASIYPAYQVTKLKPLDAIRYG